MAKRSRKTNVGVHAPPPWFRRDWFWGLMLILFVILAYTPIWHAGFIWDDDVMLKANRCIVGPLGLKEIWTTSAADICPFVLSTFWVEHALWGLEPLPYHLMNIVMHGACAVLLWRVLRSLRMQGAWLGAALWALHPVEVESVAWITEMKNTESALFFLLSILFFVKWLNFGRVASPPSLRYGATLLGWRTRRSSKSGGGPRRPLPTGGSEIRPYRASANEIRPYRAYILSLLFAALAMASKSSTAILPLVLCLCAWWIEGRWNWRNIIRVLPVFLMSVAASVLAIWTQGLQLASVPNSHLVRSWPERLATAGHAIWFYLGKLLWPHPLVAIYPHWEIDAGRQFSYLPLLAAIILFLSLLWLLRSRFGHATSRACLFAFAYFVIALLPVLGLVDNYVFHSSLVFDHFQYLAGMGPLALAGAALAWSWKEGIGVSACRRIGAAAGITGLLMILGMVSYARARVFESQETLWTDTLAKNPDCWIGHNNLGLILLKKERVDEAREHFQRAMELNPNSFLVHANLGNALFKEGELDQAVVQYQKATQINPNYFGIHYNLGVAFFRTGQFDQAMTQFEETLRLKPDFGPAKKSLERLWEESKK
jgi:tetratricopeptide (TPR) repeat protein